jgi:hypothetical protein
MWCHVIHYFRSCGEPELVTLTHHRAGAIGPHATQGVSLTKCQGTPIPPSRIAPLPE